MLRARRDGIFSREVKGDDSDSERYRISSPYEILDTTHVMEAE